jgi:multidrug efflux pump subunit AcrA (membrane-fusion protein)
MSTDRLSANMLLAAALFCWAGCKTTPAQKPAATSAKKPTSTATTGTNAPTKNSKGQIDAVLESAEMAAIKVAPRSWTDFTIVEAVSHGARVKKGDILVRCETDKIKEQISDLEQDGPASKLALELATAELENLKQTTPLKLETAKRTNRQADEDYTYFETVGRAQREKNAHFNVKSSEQRLENAMEELTQLEKMYQADDLTEETEEIIIKRQRFSVEAAKLSLESSKLFAERELKTFLPREHENLKNAKRDQELSLVLAEQTLPRTLSKKIYDLEKMKRDQKKAEKKLADLTHDIELLTVRAPAEGVVYYGANENGKWPGAAAIAKRLVPGGKLSPNEVFITIVNPEKMVLKAIVPEAELSNFKEGQKGQASPVSAPDKKLSVKLEQLGYVPAPGGGFEAVLSIEQEEDSRLMPGMSCKVTLGAVEKEKTESAALSKDAAGLQGK